MTKCRAPRTGTHATQAIFVPEIVRAKKKVENMPIRKRTRRECIKARFMRARSLPDSHSYFPITHLETEETARGLNRFFMDILISSF